jgi:tetratricopeptide (TPR) repeat protein
MDRSSSLARARVVALALAVSGMIAASAPVFAASTDGGSGGASTTTTCKTGFVFNKAKGICDKAQSGLIDDKDLYAQGRALALAGEYRGALTLFDLVVDKQDANVLTMIGYSKRKMGAVEDGIAFYHKALAIDPNNINTREYLGEGYVSMGRLDLAQAELDRIGSICGENCEQYIDLAAAMAGDSNWN